MNDYINKNMKMVEGVMDRLRKAREKVARLEREAAERIVDAAREIANTSGDGMVKVRSHHRSAPLDPSTIIDVKSHDRGLPLKSGVNEKQKKLYEKCCPQCETTFRTANKATTTCSRRCSNIHFQKGDYLPKVAAKAK